MGLGLLQEMIDRGAVEPARLRRAAALVPAVRLAARLGPRAARFEVPASAGGTYTVRVSTGPVRAFCECPDARRPIACKHALAALAVAPLVGLTG